MSPEQLITILFIAIGLAMDCFAVSVTQGIGAKKDRVRSALILALSFGAFQAAMPVVGWLAGETIIGIVAVFDHWIAFTLLLSIGAKMILESREPETERGDSELTMPILFTLSVATSIDALAVGLTIAFLEIPIYLSAAIIGAASFSLSLVGFNLGKKAGKGFGRKMEAAGGAVLIGIGFKILLEHML